MSRAALGAASCGGEWVEGLAAMTAPVVAKRSGLAAGRAPGTGVSRHGQHSRHGLGLFQSVPTSRHAEDCQDDKPEGSLIHRPYDHAPRANEADRRRDLQAAVRPDKKPQNRLKDLPAIQRIDREHVEDEQAGVNLRDYFEKALKAERTRILDVRASKHPNLDIAPCAGSFFRNVEPTSSAGRRQAAGWFLERAGAFDLRVGGASVYEKHANIVVKEDGCTAQDVLELSQKMENAVHERFGLRLTREVQLVGDFMGHTSLVS